MSALDSIDFAILKALQENGRMTNADLAEKVCLHPPVRGAMTCWRNPA